MKQKIKYLVASLALGLASSAGVVLPAAAAGASGAAGQAKQDVCAGVNVAGGTCDDDGAGISNVLKLVVNILSIVAGAVAVIMIVIAGLRYVTSGGDASKVAGAKSAIIYAIIGLVIVALSQGISAFVLGNVNKTT